MRRVRSILSGARGLLPPCARFLPLLVLAACGMTQIDDPPDLAAPMASATTSTNACCDPEAGFPQVLGTIHFVNQNERAVTVELFDTAILTASPKLATLARGEVLVVTISALSCPPDGSSMLVVQKDQPSGTTIATDEMKVFGHEQCAKFQSIVDLIDRAKGGDPDALTFLTGLVASPVGLFVLHSAAGVPAKVPEDESSEILFRGILRAHLDAFGLARNFGESAVEPQGLAAPDYPCGAGPNGFTVCPDVPALMPVGDYVFAWLATNGTIPVADAARHYQYGFVFDADGIASNDYVPSASFPNDFFAGSDRWYAVQYDPVDGWRLVVTDARNNVFTPIPSAARAVITDNGIGLFVPASEFDVAEPAYRVTAFSHSGDYGIPPPHDWSGDLDPTVAEGLSAWEED